MKHVPLHAFGKKKLFQTDTIFAVFYSTIMSWSPLHVAKEKKKEKELVTFCWTMEWLGSRKGICELPRWYVNQY
jgi:hypothetical protein